MTDYKDRAQRLTKFVSDISECEYDADVLANGFALVFGATDEDFENYLDPDFDPTGTKFDTDEYYVAIGKKVGFEPNVPA